MTEVAALAGLLAQVVELAAERPAIFPAHLETIAEQAMEHESVRAALLTAQKDETVSMPDSAGISGVEPCPSCNATAGVQQDSGTTPSVQAWSRASWLDHLAGNPTATRSVLRGLVAIAEQAPALTDEQLRDRLAALGRLVR
jgi:hypothetical protein